MDPAKEQQPFVYIGIASSVVALRKEDGAIEWSTRLRKSTMLVSLLVEGGFVYAVASGEISCLEARTGALVWHNELKGYGRSWAILAGGGQDIAGSAAVAQAQAASAASVVTMIAATSAATAASSH